MLGLLFAGVVTGAVGYLIAKKAYAPAVLMIAGVTLMVLGVAFGLGQFLPPKQATGIIFFDLFEALRRMFSTRLAGLGFSIMAIAGFSRYMDYLKASEALFAVVGAPLKYIRNPYVLLMGCHLVAQFISLFVPSSAGCCLLLMVTMYPIMVRCGISRLTACAVICSSRALSMGPAAPNAVFASGLLEMNPATYFMQYQLPIVSILVVVMGATHFFTQRYFDTVEGPDLEGAKMLAEEDAQAKAERPPRYYAILPILPLVAIIGCSPMVTNYFGLPPVKLHVAAAMLASLFIAMAVELIRTRNVMKLLASVRNVFDQMGKQFTIVVALIVSGEIFARGLVTVGAVNTLISGAQSIGLGGFALTILAAGIIVLFGFLMGSGNAPFFSFGTLVPDMAAQLAIPGISMLVIWDLASAFGRTLSPVHGACIALSGMAGVSPFSVAKREIVPMAVMCILTPILGYFFLPF